MVAPAVMDPAPFSVHKMVPFVALAPLTVAVAFEQIVCVPPAVAVGNGLMLTDIEAQVVVLQVPLYRTKYVVSVIGETLMLAPVPSAVPPQDPENHSAMAPVPAVPPFKVNVVDSPAQIAVVPVMFVGAMERVLTVIGKFTETTPFPQPLVPFTLRFPEVAFEANVTEILLVVPVIVAPVPE